MEQLNSRTGRTKSQTSLAVARNPIVQECRVCGSRKIETLWDLRASPYGDLFREDKGSALTLVELGLTLAICESCQLLQILEQVDPDQIYSNYLYQTDVTVGLPMFYSRLARELSKAVGLSEGDLVIDVGSNDGSGLVEFKNLGLDVLGIEPASGPAAKAVQRGIPTRVSFLSQSVCDEIVDEFGRARLICANAVLANIPNPAIFLKALAGMLADDGVVSIVTGYHPDEFAVNMFDYINHDHLSYFSVASMSRLAEIVGLELVSAARVEHKGGSIHFLLAPPGHPIIRKDETVEKLLQREQWLGANEPRFINSLRARVSSVGQEVRNLIEVAEPAGIAGIGASISTTHLLHEFEIGEKISALYDDDQMKIGRFSPGFGIQVRAMPEIVALSGSPVILLSWQHTVPLLQRLEKVGFSGRVIIPLPEPKVVCIGGASN